MHKRRSGDKGAEHRSRTKRANIVSVMETLPTSRNEVGVAAAPATVTVVEAENQGRLTIWTKITSELAQDS